MSENEKIKSPETKKLSKEQLRTKRIQKEIGVIALAIITIYGGVEAITNTVASGATIIKDISSHKLSDLPFDEIDYSDGEIVDEKVEKNEDGAKDVYVQEGDNYIKLFGENTKIYNLDENGNKVEVDVDSIKHPQLARIIDHTQGMNDIGGHDTFDQQDTNVPANTVVSFPEEITIEDHGQQVRKSIFKHLKEIWVKHNLS